MCARRLSFVALLAFLTGCHGSTAWQEYRDPAGRFRVESPGTLEDFSKVKATVLALRNPGITFSVSFEDVPAGAKLNPSS